MDLFTIPKEDIINQIERKESFEKGNEEVLLWASINGYNNIIKSLIEANKEEPGKFPLKVNKYWNLALRYAAEHGHIETIQLLLDAGADEPTNDDILITRTDKKTGKDIKVTANYTTEISPECGITLPERYNYLLLDWFMDNCIPSIFDMIRKHIENKNQSFVYSDRPKNNRTGKYMSRWTNKGKSPTEVKNGNN